MFDRKDTMSSSRSMKSSAATTLVEDHDQAALRANDTMSMITPPPSLYRRDTPASKYDYALEELPVPAYTQSPSKPRLVRMPSVQTRYMEMLLHLDRIPRLHNILAGVFTWILLAGFLVVPGTFTSFKNSEAFKDADNNNQNTVAHEILHSVAHLGLLAVSGICCGAGGLGCAWLWLVWRENYIFLINKIFLPASLNSLAGLLTTVVSVYTAQQGVWSVTARISAIFTSSCLGVAGGLFAIYNFWLLEKVRELHEKECPPELNPKKSEGESLWNKIRRKAKEPPLQPGSVV